MTVPLALIVVVAIIGATLIAATGVISYKVYSSRAKLQKEAGDLEAQEPVRKLRVRHGRVVSTTSTIFSASEKLVKWPASKISSRPSSINTLMLEEDIRAYRQDYPPLPRDTDGNLIGIPPEKAERKSLHPIEEKVEEFQSLQSPTRTYLQSGKQIESATPLTDIVESSWQTYNGHRKSDDVLSSPIESTPRLDLDIKLANVQPPPPTKSRGSRRSRSSRSFMQSSEAKAEDKSLAKPLTPIAPKPRKPAQLNLTDTSSKELDYGFPSPPPSSTFSPPSHLLSAPHGSVSPPTSVTPARTSVYVSDIESRPSRSTSRRRRSSVNSRSSSRHRSKSEHRVRKRPPPPIITPHMIPVAITSATSCEHESEPNSATFLTSPTASEATLAPMKSIGRLAGRKSARLSVQTFASSDLSPTFAVSPVFRMPLYAGKGSRGPKVKLIGSKDGNPTKEDRSSILRTSTSPNANNSNSSWPPSDICKMLMQAHGIAQSLEPMTPSPKQSPRTVLPEQQTEPDEQRSADGSLNAKMLRHSLSQRRSLSAHPSATLTQVTSEPASAKDDAKHFKIRESLRPGLSQARSLSGNITLSSAQTQAHGERNAASTSGAPSPPTSQNPRSSSVARGTSRRNRYDHIIDDQASVSPPRKDSTVSVGSDRHVLASGPQRKASLPASMPETSHGPPDPAVLSKILGLTPPSPSAKSPQFDSPSGPQSAPMRSFGLPSDSPRFLQAPPLGVKNARGVGLDLKPKSRRHSTKNQLFAGGKENALGITAKELEVDRVTNDLSLMSSGFAEKGMRRGAISVDEVSV